MEYITIKSYQFSTEANIVKGLLESEGIKCYLQNDDMISFDPFFFTPNKGGIRLNVLEQDVDRALQLLEDNNFESIEGD